MSDPHVYASPSGTDSRSPCPALNALANHGYLPRDGRNISFSQTIHVMKEVYNISYFFGFILALVGMLACGQWWSLPWKMDLHDLAKHNKIEHDNSQCHRDSGPGELFAPCRADRALLDHFLDVTSKDYFTILDFARARIQRARENRKSLNLVHRIIAHGEASLTLCVLGKAQKAEDEGIAIFPKVVPRSFIEQWYGDERLPDGWQRPDAVVGFGYTTSTLRKTARACTNTTVGVSDPLADSADFAEFLRELISHGQQEAISRMNGFVNPGGQVTLSGATLHSMLVAFDAKRVVSLIGCRFASVRDHHHPAARSDRAYNSRRATYSQYTYL
ncbi:hypothetical protein EIP86_004800 [Pleurotus ostreatoroseus]|nr:hypothetical protein EIP86_004800 [Pleurotus ostreatoroseus]